MISSLAIHRHTSLGLMPLTAYMSVYSINYRLHRTRVTNSSLLADVLNRTIWV